MRAFRRRVPSVNTLLAAAAAIVLLVVFDHGKPSPLTPAGASLAADGVIAHPDQFWRRRAKTSRAEAPHHNGMELEFPGNQPPAFRDALPLHPVPPMEGTHLTPGQLAVQRRAWKAPVGSRF